MIILQERSTQLTSADSSTKIHKKVQEVWMQNWVIYFHICIISHNKNPVSCVIWGSAWLKSVCRMRGGGGCHADSYRRGWNRWRPGRCGRWGRCAAAGRWCCRWWPPCAAPTPAGRAACSPLPTATWGATSSVAAHTNTHTRARTEGRGMLARPGAHTQAHGQMHACAQIPLIHPRTHGALIMAKAWSCI